MNVQKSLKPETNISLITIIKAGYTKKPIITELETRIKIIETTNILSAIGSRKRPKLDSISNFLAKYPSRKSEIHATAYSKRDNQL